MDRSTESVFRCPVQPEQSAGTLILGRKRIPVTLVDTSVEGFTVTVRQKFSRMLRHDREWTLVFNGEHSLVHPEWMFNSPDGDTQLGIRRIQDVTPIDEMTGTRKWNGISLMSFSGPALAGMIMLIIALVSLPGIGDDLGTAPAIQSFLKNSVMDLSRSLRQFLTS